MACVSSSYTQSYSHSGMPSRAPRTLAETTAPNPTQTARSPPRRLAETCRNLVNNVKYLAFLYLFFFYNFLSHSPPVPLLYGTCAACPGLNMLSRTLTDGSEGAREESLPDPAHPGTGWGVHHAHPANRLSYSFRALHSPRKQLKNKLHYVTDIKRPPSIKGTQLLK